MSAKHTPGPWLTSTSDYVIANMGELGHCGVALVHNVDGNQAANAHLIAAAPELLAALKDAERMVTWAINNRAFNPDYQFTAETHIGGIRAAIAKAEAHS